jgi:high-affinity Fe2+/Pb2+ permease
VGFLLELLFDVVFEVVVSAAGALHSSWGDSDSPVLKIVAFAILAAIGGLIAFLVYWFLIR